MPVNILNHFDDAQLTHSRKAWTQRSGRCAATAMATALRRYRLSSEQLQKRVRVQQQTKVKRKRFNKLNDDIM